MSTKYWLICCVYYPKGIPIPQHLNIPCAGDWVDWVEMVAKDDNGSYSITHLQPITEDQYLRLGRIACTNTP